MHGLTSFILKACMAYKQMSMDSNQNHLGLELKKTKIPSSITPVVGGGCDDMLME